MAFKIFRAIVGIIVVACGLWMIVNGVDEIMAGVRSSVSTEGLVMPMLRVIAGLA
ncbi:hypothetical protein LCGC14_2393380, partial [marine sediment metagenome]